MTPTIETKRLALRGHRTGDFDNCFSLWSHPLVTRYIGGRPATAEEVWTKLLRYVGHWQLLGFGYWVIEDRASGTFVGEVGLADFRRDIDPPIVDAAEAGWVLAPACHGRGYATEAVRAVLDWADSTLGSRRTVCIIAPNNAPSIRVATKSGFRHIADTTYHGEPTLMFERGAP